MTARQRIPLDGPWKFYFDRDGNADPGKLGSYSPWRVVNVPQPWQAQFADLRNRGGVGWYRRTIELDRLSPGRAAVLHFGAVDYHATVWVNGQLLCKHEGGYLPFEADAAPLLVPGANEIVVRVIDPDDDSELWSPFAFSQIPHGKQSWYGPISGIWQSVWLELRAEYHFVHLKLTPDLHRGTIAVVTSLAAEVAPDDSWTVGVTVHDPDGKMVAGTEIVAAGLQHVQCLLTLAPTDVLPWSPDHPALYSVRAVLRTADRVVDEIRDFCGFRTVEAHNGRIHLNGSPIYLRGALDQAYYPETIYTPPSLEFLEAQLREAKKLGFNCLRCHIKLEDPRYYALADRLGLLIWAEVPSWMHLMPAATARVEATLAAMIARDWNHPSVIAWTLVNEDWGTDLVHNDEHRRWLAGLYRRAKELDPTRLVVDNSPCHPNAHLVSDIEDYHHYRAIPDNAAAWDAWVADFATRPKWTWSTGYEHLRRKDLPLIVSEFGNWGLPDPRRLEEHGSQPWWFDTGYDWGEGLVTPHGLQARFHSWRLDRVFGSFDAFIHACQEHMARSLAYEIASIRRRPAIGGYVVTELTDVHWEANGLMDFQRNVKAGVADYVAPVNAETVVSIDPMTWSAEPGTEITVRLTAFDVLGPTERGRLHWRAGTTEGEIAAPGGDIRVPIPEQAGSRVLSVRVGWIDGSEQRAMNQVQLTSVDVPECDDTVFVHDSDELAAALENIGYTVVDATLPAGDNRIIDSAQRGVIVASHFSEDLQKQIRNGARALLLAGEGYLANPANVPLPLGEQTKLVAREDSWWEGDWASSICWLRKRGPFAHLPGGPILDLAYADVMPRTVLTIEPHRILKQNIWCGLAVGWLHKLAGVIVYTDYGEGALAISTLQLTPTSIRDNAIARGLLRGLMELAATGGDTPD